MRVFVTGAAGFIGRAVVQDLLKNGHQVLGLARSDASAALIAKAGAEVHRGDLEDVESLKSGAKAADGVIHLAFIHDFSNYAGAVAVDRAAIEAMGSVLAGTGKPLVIASGLLGLVKGQVGTEDSEPDRSNPTAGRALSADVVRALSKEQGIRGIVVRLPPTVHGTEDQGFIPMIAKMGQAKGVITYVDDGSARWPAVHRLDAAVLFRLALEKGEAAGTYHAVGEQGIPMKDIMTVVGKRLQLSVESRSLPQVTELLGFFANVINSDSPASSDKTQKALGWTPTQIGLLEDLKENYFK